MSYPAENAHSRSAAAQPARCPVAPATTVDNRRMPERRAHGLRQMFRRIELYDHATTPDSDDTRQGIRCRPIPYRRVSASRIGDRRGDVLAAVRATPVGAYRAEDKKALSTALTSVYLGVEMPTFYVNVRPNLLTTDSNTLGPGFGPRKRMGLSWRLL